MTTLLTEAYQTIFCPAAEAMARASVTIERPELLRPFGRSLSASELTLSHAEQRFLNLLFLHISGAFALHAAGEVKGTGDFKLDLQELLSLPAVRKFWEENKRYYDENFIRFGDAAAPVVEKATTPVAEGGRHVLLASAFPAKVVSAFLDAGDLISFITDKAPAPSLTELRRKGVDIVVSFGYGRLWPREVVASIPVYNVHGGLLPWNRGPNPNLWSWIHNTPKGVSIHAVDEGVDTGPIAFQRELRLNAADHTLNSSFNLIVDEAAQLLVESWPQIRNGDLRLVPQEVGAGSCHRMRDQAQFGDLMSSGADRPLPELLSKIHQQLASNERTATARTATNHGGVGN